MPVITVVFETRDVNDVADVPLDMLDMLDRLLVLAELDNGTDPVSVTIVLPDCAVGLGIIVVFINVEGEMDVDSPGDVNVLVSGAGHDVVIEKFPD